MNRGRLHDKPNAGPQLPISGIHGPKRSPRFALTGYGKLSYYYLGR